MSNKARRRKPNVKTILPLNPQATDTAMKGVKYVSMPLSTTYRSVLKE
jgi:hypothetical protein